jgi:hypothetical protein
VSKKRDLLTADVLQLHGQSERFIHPELLLGEADNQLQRWSSVAPLVVKAKKAHQPTNRTRLATSSIQKETLPRGQECLTGKQRFRKVALAKLPYLTAALFPVSSQVTGKSENDKACIHRNAGRTKGLRPCS